MMNDVCLIITKIIFNVYIGSNDNVNITKIKSYDEKLRSKAVLQLTPHCQQILAFHIFGGFYLHSEISISLNYFVVFCMVAFISCDF